MRTGNREELKGHLWISSICTKVRFLEDALFINSIRVIILCYKYKYFPKIVTGVLSILVFQCHCPVTIRWWVVDDWSSLSRCWEIREGKGNRTAASLGTHGLSLWGVLGHSFFLDKLQNNLNCKWFDVLGNILRNSFSVFPQGGSDVLHNDGDCR
jgi:hypothetical protein